MKNNRDNLDRLYERIESSDDLTDDDRDILLQFSDRLSLLRTEYTDHRHEKLLRHCTIMGEKVGGLAKALEEQEAAEKLVRWINRTYNNEYTNQDYRTALRVLGMRVTDGDDYPDSIEWIPTGMSNSYNPVPNPADMLTWEEDVLSMIEAARNPRDAAVIAVAFDSGARSGELQNLTIGDVSDHKHGLQIMVDGKTGQRNVTLVPSVPYLQKWLAEHPAPDNQNADLWCKLSKPEEISYQQFRKCFNYPAERAGITKPTTPTNFRKSNATYLVRQGMSQAHIEDRQGRKRGSDATAHYVARFGGEAEDDFARMHGLDVEEEEPEPIGPKECPRCGEKTPRHKPTCVWCQQALDHASLASLEDEKREVRDTFFKFAQTNPELIEDLQSARDFSELIEDNPQLIERAEEFMTSLED